jgi:hypothetical protein
MRTTLDIDDDLLLATKEIARRNGQTAGQVVSELLRRALTQSVVNFSGVREPKASYGFRPFPAGDRVVSNTDVDKLRDDEGI